MWCSRPSAAVKFGEKASVCSLPHTHAAAGCEVWGEVTVGRVQVTGPLLGSLSLSCSVCLPHSHTAQLVLVSTLPAVNVISGPKIVVGRNKICTAMWTRDSLLKLN